MYLLVIICTLIATSTACVLLVRPTTTEPCFTASAAYSTWNILPCGELMELVSTLVAVMGGEAWSLQCNRIVVVVVSEHGAGISTLIGGIWNEEQALEGCVVER
jgi:hypothetical protein